MQQIRAVCHREIVRQYSEPFHSVVGEIVAVVVLVGCGDS